MRPQLVIPTSKDIFASATSVVRQFDIFTRPGKNRDAADPFVIALAMTTGATVVTEEGLATKPQKFKIPDVCAQLDVPCVDVYGFVRGLGWTF